MELLGQFKIFNMPVARKLCAALASGFNNFSQVFCEFVDNAVSNLIGHADDSGLSRCIQIVIRNLQDHIDLLIEDGGTGIQDLDKAFTLCSTDISDSPLNASGCGFKNGFAYIESNGGSWSCCTRTVEDTLQNRYCYIQSPYDFGDGKLTGEYRPGWIGTLGKTGTMIQIHCPVHIVSTVNPSTTEDSSKFQDLVAYLKETLRYTYAGLLQSGAITIKLTMEDDEYTETEFLAPLSPSWDELSFKEIPPQMVDLGGGNVEIQCQYGNILGDKSNLLYYRGNMESSGAELCINGRVIEHGLLKRIWGRKVHPSQNAFLVRVNLVTDVLESIPMTKAAKSGFREEDPRLKKLFQWIRANVVLSERTVETREEKLKRKLVAKLNDQAGTTRVTQEMGVFRTRDINIPADIIHVQNDQITIYEAKYQNTQALDVYQLRMYWDGAVQDGIPPTEAILIAGKHPEEVQVLVAYMNSQTAADGRQYLFRLKTWQEEGISL